MVEYTRRVTDRLLLYWDELRGERPFPMENEIDPAKIEDLWQHCFLQQVRDFEKGERCQYSFLGKSILNAYEMHILEPGAVGTVPPTPEAVLSKFKNVAKLGKPLIEEGSGLSFNKHIRFRQVFLPVGSTGERPTFIFGAMRYKVFTENDSA
jgi:hypothetical protein